MRCADASVGRGGRLSRCSRSALLHIVKFEFVPLVMSLTLLGALIVYRQEFRALGDPRTRWRAVRVFVVLAMASFVVGVLMVFLPAPSRGGRTTEPDEHGPGGLHRAGGLQRPLGLSS
jgi:hypothetical protein